MGSLSYIPGRSTLLLLFKAARDRLMISSEYLGSLSETRLTSATEEMNRVSDDIREAMNISSVHDDAARRASELAEREPTPPALSNNARQLSGASHPSTRT
jgi:hypothetical protein